VALVTVTGNVWDHSRDPIPAESEPELWFRPAASTIAGSLLAGIESQATLNVATGAFEVELESAPGIQYTPVLRWLVNPGSELERRAYGYTEFPAFNPGAGGDIGTLPPYVTVNGIVAGYGPPPAELTDVFYLDISGPKPVLYGPEGGIQA